MSLFLGKIHYWLYNKIQWAEALEQNILEWASEKNLPVEDWKKKMYQQFGKPTEGQDLETIIDTSNIHGWLQGKIASVELRQAYLITQILNEDANHKQDVLTLFQQQGALAASKIERNIETPEDVFNALNDIMVEGMPCDHVNEIKESTDKDYQWVTTTCLHQPYWVEVEGNVNNFYELREAWVKAFVQNAGAFDYERTGFNHKIMVKQ